MTDQVDEVIKRTYRYFYIDGLVEMAVGLLFMVVGLLLLLFGDIQSLSPGGIVLAIGLPLLTIGGAYLVKWAVQRLKENVTYPRTGYVKYRPGEPSVDRRWVMLAALVLAVVAFLIPDRYAGMQLVVGILLGVILTYMGYRSKLARFYGAAIVAVLLALGTLLLNVGEIVGTSMVFVGAGLALFVSGAVVLIRYLRRHPAPGEVYDE